MALLGRAPLLNEDDLAAAGAFIEIGSGFAPTVVPVETVGLFVALEAL